MPKQEIRDLAILGGEPEFSEALHVGRPNIGERAAFLRRINDILDRRWLTNAGPYVGELEQRIQNLLGVHHCVAMCNGTVALEIAIRALNLQGEVIVPAFTFVATAHALQWQAIRPVLCDIDPSTFTLDPARIEELITPRATGIVGVHTWGRPCDIDELTRLAKRHDLKLLFDAAHALNCSYKGKMIGGFGDAEVLSFHATKVLNSFEGGAVVTNDPDLANKMRLMRNFGFSGYDTVVYVGTNGKMSEVAAAMGLTSLESLPDFIRANETNYDTYHGELAEVPGVEVIEFDPEEVSNFQYVTVLVDAETAGLSRDALMEILHAENVLVRRYFYPGVHRMEPYRSLYPNVGERLRRTEELSAQVLCMPTGTAVRPADVTRVCALIRFCVENRADVARAVSRQPA